MHAKDVVPVVAAAAALVQDPKQEYLMKISKQEFKKIVKEELGNVLEMFGRDIEGGMPNYSRDAVKPILGQLWNLVAELGQAGEDEESAALAALAARLGEKHGLGVDKDEQALQQADEKAAEEILSTRMGSYRGTTLPGGKRIK